MATLSLNGEFNHPIELKQTLIVDGKATFREKVSHGVGNTTNGECSFAFGEDCSVNADFSRAYGERSYVGENGNYSSADGYECSSYGLRSYAIGYRSSTRTRGDGRNCEDSFVWQGNTNNGDSYHSKGSGTFCINPYGTGGLDSSTIPASSTAVCGLFIGDYCITDYISSEAAKRILTNPNVFTASQTFGKEDDLLPIDVVFNGFTTFNNQNTFNGKTIFRCDTDASYNNDPDSVKNDDGIASHKYVNGIVLSAISHVGDYYPDDISETDFGRLWDYSVSLGYLSSYVGSAINNVDVFLDDKYDEMGAAASREFTTFLATSASTHTLTSNNTFSGDNGFTGDVNIYRKLISHSTATIDLKLGNVEVNDTWDKNDEKPNTIATQRFTRTVANSGVEQILNNGNVYSGGYGERNVYNIGALFSSGMQVGQTFSLLPNSVADMRQGSVYVPRPSLMSNDENEPSTTWFSRSMATSAINELLTKGGSFSNGSTVIFNGNVKFTKEADATGANFRVKNRNISDSSDYAASTKFVKDAIFDAISTSSVSVRKLVLEGKSSSGDFTTNNFTVPTNNFLNKNIYVSTMERGCKTTNAASCEFVQNALSDAFDLFDLKFADHLLPDNSKWKLQGSRLPGKDTKPYKHIYSDLINGSVVKYDTIASVPIEYRLAKDGHKIVIHNTDSERKVDDILNNTGIAWFYLISITNGSEFVILPRTTHNFKALYLPNLGSTTMPQLDELNAYVPPSLPNHTHSFAIGRSDSNSHGDTGCNNLFHGGNHQCSVATGETGNPRWFDEALQPVTIGVGRTVQPAATNKLLYFYCG